MTFDRNQIFFARVNRSQNIITILHLLKDTTGDHTYPTNYFILTSADRGTTFLY